MSLRLFEIKDEPTSLRQLLNIHLKKNYSPAKPLKITLMGAMLDGIGDFVHLLDFYKTYINHPDFAGQPIYFKCLSFVNEEFDKVVRKVYADQLPKSLYEINEAGFDEAKFAQSQFLVISKKEADKNFIIGKSIEAVKDQNGIIYVSFCLSGLPVIIISAANPRYTFIESMCEYSDESKDLYVGNEDGETPFLYDEAYMGISMHEKAKGIKINKTILELSSSDEKTKPSILNSLENQKLLTKLTSGESTADYLKSHSIACGYMQDKTDTTNFILSTTAIADKKQIDIFVNLKHVSPEELLSKLKDLGVAAIEIVSNTGETVKKIPDKVGVTKEAVNTIRLISFPGTSEADKEKWISLSDCVAGSGDTSLTEMISSKKFPVFSKSYKGGAIQNSFVSELKKIDPRPNELIVYLESALSSEESDFGNVCKYIQLHHNTILRQWKSFCDEIIKNRNIAMYQQQLIDATIMGSIFKIGNENEIEKLLTFIPDWKTNDTNFIFLALLCDNAKVLDRALTRMYSTNKVQFEKLMQEKHPSQD